MAAEVVPLFEMAASEAKRIARGLRRRDSALVSELVERYHHRLVRYLFYLGARQEHVEDLVQDTWLRVLDRAHQYDGESRLEPWLFSIARHLAIDDARRRQKIGSDLTERISDHPSPFVMAARSEEAVRLAAALDTLEPIYREALLLRYQEELSLHEISQLVGAPVSTVSSRIQRGLVALRSDWQGGTNAT